MTLKEIQPFLEQAFEFLRGREFSIDRQTWKDFCQSHGVTAEKLQSVKSELSNQSTSSSDDSQKQKQLEQIFCCDPFAAESITVLRDFWRDKEEQPFSGWSTDISIHLLEIEPEPLPTTPIPTTPIPTTPIPTLQQPKKENIVLRAVITGTIIGGFIMAPLVINNCSNQQKVTNSLLVKTSTPIVTPVSGPTTTPVFSPTTTPVSGPTYTPSLRPTSESISEQDAVNLIKRWLEAKGKLLAPPYNRAPAEAVLTDRAYECNIKRSDGNESSVEWVENNGASWEFYSQSVDKVIEFIPNRDRATITVQITEGGRLRNRNGNLDPESSYYKSRIQKYNLQLVEGQWKISYYKLPGC